METVSIFKDNAKTAYKEADNKGKALLENLLGKQVFKEKITDRIKTFEDACKELGITGDMVMSSASALSGDQKSIAAYVKLIIIARALNEGWKPDWKDTNQPKYFPWFKANPSGFGFSFDGYADRCSAAYLCSRLFFKSSELAEYAGKQFLDIYNDYMVLE